MNFVAYLDFNEKDITEDIQIAKNLNLDELIITKFNEQDLMILEENDLKELYKIIRKSKTSIYGLEVPAISKDFNDEDDYLYLVDYYTKAFEIANSLKLRKTIITLPVIKDVLLNSKNVLYKLSKIFNAAKKSRQTLYIKQGSNRNSTIAYLLKKTKGRDFKLIFEPSQVYLNGESVLVSYRLYKKYLSDILVRDLDSLNNSELIGYGRVGLLDLFKRMRRDKFNGNIILDPGFTAYDPTKKTVKNKDKRSFMSKVFRRKPKTNTYLSGFGQRIFNENKKPSIEEIYSSQITALKTIFNLQ